MALPDCVPAPVPIAVCQVVQFSPDIDGIQDIHYRVNIPSSTASTGSGPIYFQVEAPSDISYVALGQGHGMAGANIFVIYTSSDSNVTVSPRLGKGHSSPEINRDAEVTVLEGSGESNGRVIANVRCDNCLSWDGGSMDPKDSSSSWIWSMKNGAPLDSSETDELIGYHNARGVFTLDLNEGTGRDSDNPFLEFDSNDLSDSGSAVSSGNVTKRSVHGIIMAITFVVLFPTFALTLHIVPYNKTVSHIHAPLQLIALCLAIVGFGLGISLAIDVGRVSAYHPIVGFIVMGFLILFQPALGLFQHLYFRRTGGSSSLGVVHRWLGRIVLVLAIVNGGLGFKLSGIGNPGVPKGGVVAYGVIAGVIGVLYTAVVIFNAFKPKRNPTGTWVGSDAIFGEDVRMLETKQKAREIR